MQIEIGYDIQFNIPAPTPMHLLLHTLPNRYTFVKPENLYIEPWHTYETFIDAFGNQCSRLLAQPGPIRFTNHGIVEVDGRVDDADWNAWQHPVQELPPETTQYLLSSRYCEVDRLTDFAWQQFGNGPTGYARAQAVVDYVHNLIQFSYPNARNTRTAFDAWNEHIGVCRDFAHLSITLCRCLGIPARYATGYLGDIGVPWNPAPMDFSAWFEVYLGGRWFTLDARHNQLRIGRIVMAYGRDAADTAITTSFGPTVLTKFEVITNELK